MENIEPFDWQRIFLGDLSWLFLLEVVFRTTFMYLYALLVIRLIGKRGLGQLTPFEFIIVIALGSATGDPMFYPDIPLLHGVVVLTTVVALEKVISELTQRYKPVESFVESKPTPLISHGKLLKGSLKELSLGEEEFLMRLRQSGVADVSTVQYAIMEPSGKLSVFPYTKDQKKKTRSTIKQVKTKKK